MSYDAIFRAQTALTTLLADLSDTAVAVGVEQGITCTPTGTIYTRPLSTWPMDEKRPVELMGPTGPLDGNAQSTTSELVYWVTISGRDADAATLDTELKCYLTAAVRVLDNQNASDGRWSVYCGRIDYAPPTGRADEPFLGAVGVEVTVKIAG